MYQPEEFPIQNQEMPDDWSTARVTYSGAWQTDVGNVYPVQEEQEKTITIYLCFLNL